MKSIINHYINANGFEAVLSASKDAKIGMLELAYNAKDMELADCMNQELNIVAVVRKSNKSVIKFQNDAKGISMEKLRQNVACAISKVLGITIEGSIAQ
jgi:hypothetical protein